MSKETLPQAPLEIDWCYQTSPPCPYKGPNCGIKSHLRCYYGERRKEEAERLLALAKEDPEEFWRTCARGLWGY